MPSFSHNRRRKRPSSSPPAPPAARDWAALPPDILFAVFLKLGPRRIMQGADRACTSWRRIAVGEPALWRRINLTTLVLWFARGPAVLQAAMERSAGQGEAFSGRGCDDASLRYLVRRAPSLKSLCLLDCEAFNVGEAIRKLPLLENLKMTLIFDTSSHEELLQSICEACPRLEKLSLRLLAPSRYTVYYNEDTEIHGVMKCLIPIMRELRSLELTHYDLTEKKLMAIIDNCPLLESLRMSPCISPEKVEELKHRYARGKIQSADYYY